VSVVLDTHAVLWYLENSKELSLRACETIEGAIRQALDVFVSAISVVETIYLAERQRVSVNALHRLQSALQEPSSGLRIAPVDGDVANALVHIPRVAVPDMPDRIIAATALHLGLPLITRDHRIQSTGIKTIW
jgi:PIN domain nuclease of toxin-antitoxin system